MSPLLSVIAETRASRLIKVLMILAADAELPKFKEAK